MDLNTLRYFLATIETGSFAGAAVQLGLTQPAVSRQIRLLEKELGTPLVTPIGPRRMGPTPAGETLLAGARRLTAELGSLAEEVRHHAAEPLGPLSVAVPPAIGLTLLQAVLPDYMRRYPRVRLTVLSGYSGYVENWLQTGEADMGFLYGEPSRPEIAITPFFELDMFVIAPKPEAARDPRLKAIGESCSLEALSRLPLILPGRHHGLRILVDTAMSRAGLPAPEVVIEVDNLPLLRRLVIEGVGCAVLGYDGVRSEVAAGALRLVPLGGEGLKWRLAFARLSRRQDSPAAQALQAMTVEAARQLISKDELRGRDLFVDS
jgi:LysR family nitrogen assimilation transcriptional regulator